MSTNLTPQERRNRRRTGLLAGLAGGVLLVGGSTFALWSDSDTQTGGTITNGNLDVAKVGSVAYYDTSTDRTDANAEAGNPVTRANGHGVADIAAYSIVPGDKLEANYPFAVALDGDNMVAKISASLPTGTAAQGVTFTAQAYYLNNGTWTAVGTPQALNASGTAADLGNFQADLQLNGLPDSPLPIITKKSVDTDANVTVVVRASFDAATANRVSTQATSVLGDVKVDVAQIRTAGVGNFS